MAFKPKIGRPSLGFSEVFTLRMTPELLARIDLSADNHLELRYEAVRRLLAQALDAEEGAP